MMERTPISKAPWLVLRVDARIDRPDGAIVTNVSFQELGMHARIRVSDAVVHVARTIILHPCHRSSSISLLFAATVQSFWAQYVATLHHVPQHLTDTTYHPILTALALMLGPLSLAVVWQRSN